MNDIIRNSIETRRNAIFNTYDIKDENTLNLVEDFFRRLEEFGNNYNDIMAFETDFANSSLNQEYMNLFTIVASKASVRQEVMNAAYAQDNSVPQKSVEEEAIEYVADEVVDSVAHGIKRQARQEAYDQVRDIPGVGQVLEAKQYMDFFGRFRKNKDKDAEKDKEENK